MSKLTTLDYASLVHARSCKNRTSLHFALATAVAENLPSIEFLRINRAFNMTIEIIKDIDALLDFLGRPGAHPAP